MDMNKLLWKLNDIETGAGKQTAYKPGGENADLVNILNKFNLIAEGKDPKQLPADFEPRDISTVLGKSGDVTDPMKGYFFGEDLDGNTPDSGEDGDEVGNTQINMTTDEPTPIVPTESMDGVSTDTKNILENGNHSPVVQAITNRIIRSELDLLSQYGPEFVMNAIDEVGEYVGDVDEIGTSDVSAWVEQVRRILADRGDGKHMEEGAVKRSLESTPTHGMFTEKGNKVVDAIITNSSDLKTALAKLRALSKREGFEEAWDTVVRDDVSGYFDDQSVDEGYRIMPNIDRERYTDLSAEGLEGPFQTDDGRIVYYDPKAGQYYDRDTDMYLDRDEVNMTESLEKRLSQELMRTKRQPTRVAEEVANEDVVSAVKKTLGDYLKSLGDEVKSDPDLKDKVEKAVDVLGPVVKSIMADNGKSIKVHGNEDDGFRVSIQDKPAKSTFKSIDEAVMAIEMLNARVRKKAAECAEVPAEIETPAEPARVVRPAANRLAAKLNKPVNPDYVDEK